jgi:aerotaxis receptor
MSYSDIITKADGEVRFTSDAYILSETDSKGVIKYANGNFLKISGYDINEVIGHNQNLLRHQDMPKEIFRQLWYSISNKGYWRGYIKNKTKDGKFYWIKTTILKKINMSGKASFLATSVTASADEVARMTKQYDSMR